MVEDKLLIENAMLQAEVARLREIVDRLPVTADGVRVVPNGDYPVWWWDLHYRRPLGSAEIEWYGDEWRCLGGSHSVSECYSTREAALAAKEANES